MGLMNERRFPVFAWLWYLIKKAWRGFVYLMTWTGYEE
jgi:hypothetical protein